MKSFTPADYTVLFGYMVLVALLGSSFYRKRTTADEYFRGGRGMSWLPVGISIIAADTSAITLMGAPAWAYANNLELLWSYAGPILAAR